MLLKSFKPIFKFNLKNGREQSVEMLGIYSEPTCGDACLNKKSGSKLRSSSEEMLFIYSGPACGYRDVYSNKKSQAKLGSLGSFDISSESAGMGTTRILRCK